MLFVNGPFYDIAFAHAAVCGGPPPIRPDIEVRGRSDERPCPRKVSRYDRITNDVNVLDRAARAVGYAYRQFTMSDVQLIDVSGVDAFVSQIMRSDCFYCNITKGAWIIGSGQVTATSYSSTSDVTRDVGRAARSGGG